MPRLRSAKLSAMTHAERSLMNAPAANIEPAIDSALSRVADEVSKDRQGARAARATGRAHRIRGERAMSRNFPPCYDFDPYRRRHRRAVTSNTRAAR